MDDFQVKRIRTLRRARDRDVLVAIVLSFGTVGCTIIGFQYSAGIKQHPLVVMGAVLTFLSVVVTIGSVRQWKRTHRFRCPDCHELTERRLRPPRKRVLFDCRNCRITWDTGLDATVRNQSRAGPLGL